MMNPKIRAYVHQDGVLSGDEIRFELRNWTFLHMAGKQLIQLMPIFSGDIKPMLH